VNTDWITPHWPVPARVHAVCTTRAGGVSHAPFDSMNLGAHVGDHAVDVGRNRALLHEAIEAKPVFLSQVHGVDVVQLANTTTHGTQADACITQQGGVACTIMVADCLPVLFTNWQGSMVAAAHAGWRGLVGAGGVGVLETTFKQFEALALVNRAQGATNSVASSVGSSVARETLVWLGPCIGAQQFEVGDEVRDAFVAHDRAALALFTLHHHDKWLADLQGLARLRLRAMGITQIYGNDGNRRWCTVSNPSRFFSHRRDSVALGGTGRMAASIWLG
jgi:copper oxidase (laccase) domain-containing protein